MTQCAVDSVFHMGWICLVIFFVSNRRLVIASRFHPCPVLMGLLKFLAPSRPFVVYSQFKEVSASHLVALCLYAWLSEDNSLSQSHLSLAASAHRFLLLRVTAVNVFISLLQHTSLSLPRNYNAHHVPALITSIVLVLLKRSVCVCVAMLVLQSSSSSMPLFHLCLCSLLSSATQSSRNMAARSTSSWQTLGSDIIR